MILVSLKKIKLNVKRLVICAIDKVKRETLMDKNSKMVRKKKTTKLTQKKHQ